MNPVVKQILALESINTLSKHEQIIEGILNSINEKIIKNGDVLPSVNTLIKELGFARETIAKAYRELVSRGIIESKNRLGYFVATEDIEQELKVALVIFAFDIFQENFYESFRKGLGSKIQLDVFFHHNNLEIFQSVVEKIKGKYGRYVVAPISDPGSAEILELLPAHQVLIVDRELEAKEGYSFIVQEFRQSSYKAFLQLKDQIKKYDQMVFYFKPSSAEPIEILESFQRFVREHDINAVIEEKYEPGSLKAGTVYFTINNRELWEMLKDSKLKGLKLGKDVGFISHNDDIVKEIIFDGVTTFSTDFSEMGKAAADYIKQRAPKMIGRIIPTVLIKRHSL